MTGPRKHRRRRGAHSDDLRPEYDFRELGPGVRGKYYERAIAGPIVVTLVPDSEVRKARAKRPKATTRRAKRR